MSLKPAFKNVHSKFKFNNLSFNREELKEVAYCLVKEGLPFEQSIGDFLIDWLNDKTHVEVQTSGTTGTPKTIRLDKQHMVNSAIATGNFFKINPGDSALHCLPSKFIAGKMMLVRAMILGLEIDVVPPSSNPLDKIDSTYDFCAMVPLQVQNSITRLHHIKKLIIGGAKASNDLIQKIQGIPVEAYETYGMTETITHIAAKKLNHFKDQKEKLNAAFKTLPGVLIKTDDRNCLIIDVPKVSDKKIITNDVVEIISENTFHWLGRYDNIINSGGIKLIPEQIESKLTGIIKGRFFVTSKKDKQLGEKLVLVVEGANNSEEELLDKIKKLNTISKYEIPKEILFSDHLKTTKNGKIIRSLE
ncbi:AMP-binding protein [Flavobacteriaceae bacterium R38]|nr:AMP-binding protein [Flavobacteriaceae bacterium R38]